MFETIQDKLKNKLEIVKALQAENKPIPLELKIRVAVLADSPTVATGFGNVCKQILGVLYETGLYEFDIVGINYDGTPHTFPYRIFPAFNGLIPDPNYRDVYGKQKFLDILGLGEYDLVWILQDTFILEHSQFAQRIAETNQGLAPEKKFSTIFYFPIDATPRKSWIDNSVILTEHPVAYTRYAHSEVLKLYDADDSSLLSTAEQEKNLKIKTELEGSMNIIYHGTNLQDFHPETPEVIKVNREKFWDRHKDKFIFINVNRNQPRKDLFRTLLAFKKLLDRRRAKGKDDVYLYMHCNVFDSGLNLLDMSKQIGLVEGDEFAHPDPRQFNPSAGFPVEVVNSFYNASDCLVSTSLGEGWGLSLTEAMAVKIPVIAPDHTSTAEILGKTDKGMAERGFIVKTDNCFVQHDDNSRVRPLTDVDDLVEKMEFVVDNREAIQPVVERAYEWVKTLEWGGELVGGKWRTIFEQAYLGTIGYRALEVDKLIGVALKEKKLGRNEECPICTPVKYKNCRHYV